MLSRFNCVRHFATPWTIARQGCYPWGCPGKNILEWIAISFSRGSSQPRDQTHVSYVSCIAGRFFTTEPPGIPLSNILHSPNTDREPQFTQRRNCPRQQQSGVSNLNCLAPGSVSLNTCPYLGPQLSLAPSLPACTSRQTLPSRLYCDPTEDAVHKAHASAACD